MSPAAQAPALPASAERAALPLASLLPLADGVDEEQVQIVASHRSLLWELSNSAATVYMLTGAAAGIDAAAAGRRG